MKIVTILILLIPALSYGQPGGGGKLTIHNLYDSLGILIDFSNDSTYQVKFFLLNDTLVATTDIYSVIPYRNISSRQTNISTYLDSTEYSAIQVGPISPIAHYRMFISTETDTMVIDFINIIGANPIGQQTHIDSLMYRTCYIQYKKKNKHHGSVPFDNQWNITKLNQINFSLLYREKVRRINNYEKHMRKNKQ